MSAPIENNDSDNKMPSESCVVVQGEDVLLELDFKNKELKEDVIQWVSPQGSLHICMYIVLI